MKELEENIYPLPETEVMLTTTDTLSSVELGIDQSWTSSSDSGIDQSWTSSSYSDKPQCLNKSLEGAEEVKISLKVLLWIFNLVVTL